MCGVLAVGGREVRAGTLLAVDVDALGGPTDGGRLFADLAVVDNSQPRLVHHVRRAGKQTAQRENTNTLTYCICSQSAPLTYSFY